MTYVPTYVQYMYCTYVGTYYCMYCACNMADYSMRIYVHMHKFVTVHIRM